MKKENIAIETSLNELNSFSQKIISLKEKIEKEINQINELYDKTLDDLTKSFLKKHEQLIKEENDLKEKLQNKVTNIKEKLEYYLSESNNSIKINEKINQGIKKFEKEEKNIDKLLSYSSKINKTNKLYKSLFKELIKSLKFSYNEENGIIKFEEYYINGIPTPKNIVFKDIFFFSLTIYWEIDNINIINFDKSKIKYELEMRKEKETFKQIYEGCNNSYSVNNLSPNTNYEFIIYSFYNDITSSESQIQKIKTIDFNCDSIILNESKKKEEFLKKYI